MNIEQPLIHFHLQDSYFFNCSCYQATETKRTEQGETKQRGKNKKQTNENCENKQAKKSQRKNSTTIFDFIF